MDLPHYNLYESYYISEHEKIQYYYFVSVTPLREDDKVILKDLDTILDHAGYMGGFLCLVKKEHFINGHAKIADDFDVCSPIWLTENYAIVRKFARKDFGADWRKTYVILWFPLRFRDDV